MEVVGTPRLISVLPSPLDHATAQTNPRPSFAAAQAGNIPSVREAVPRGGGEEASGGDGETAAADTIEESAGSSLFGESPRAVAALDGAEVGAEGAGQGAMQAAAAVEGPDEEAGLEKAGIGGVDAAGAKASAAEAADDSEADFAAGLRVGESWREQEQEVIPHLDAEVALPIDSIEEGRLDEGEAAPLLVGPWRTVSIMCCLVMVALFQRLRVVRRARRSGT